MQHLSPRQKGILQELENTTIFEWKWKYIWRETATAENPEKSKIKMGMYFLKLKHCIVRKDEQSSNVLCGG